MAGAGLLLFVPSGMLRVNVGVGIFYAELTIPLDLVDSKSIFQIIETVKNSLHCTIVM